MVTLVGVRMASLEMCSDSLLGRAVDAVSGDGLCSLGLRSDVEELGGSADMLLYDRSPLSRRGRFLVLEGPESSIGSSYATLGPSDLARVGVGAARSTADSMTFCATRVSKPQQNVPKLYENRSCETSAFDSRWMAKLQVKIRKRDPTK